MGGQPRNDEREARETFPAELFRAWASGIPSASMRST